MTRRTVTIEEKITRQEAVVAAAKHKYDAAVDELEKLIAKRRGQDDKKVLVAYHAGDKTADDIIAFIKGKTEGED